MLERLKELIMWKKARVFSIDYETGEVILKTKNDMFKIYFSPDKEEAGIHVNEEVLYRYINVNNSKKLLMRVKEKSNATKKRDQ